MCAAHIDGTIQCLRCLLTKDFSCPCCYGFLNESLVLQSYYFYDVKLARGIDFWFTFSNIQHENWQKKIKS